MRYVSTIAVVLCVAVIVVAQAFGQRAQHQVKGCADITVIDLHGSSEKANTASPPGQLFFADLKALLQPKTVALQTVPFTAAGGAPTLVEAALKFPAAYYQSVTKMKNWLRGLLNKQYSQCKVILVGYSQGAQAAADVYQEKAWPNVDGLVLFGDPYFNASDAAVDQLTYKTGNNGSLGQRPRFAKPSLVRSYCHSQDLVCQLSVANILRFVSNKLKIPAHNNYGVSKEPSAAANYFAAMLSASSITKPPAKKVSSVASASSRNLGQPLANATFHYGPTSRGYSASVHVAVYGVHHSNALPALPYTGRSYLAACTPNPYDGVIPVAYTVTNTTPGYSMATQIGMDVLAGGETTSYSGQHFHLLGSLGEAIESDTTECSSRNSGSLWMYGVRFNNPILPGQTDRTDFFIVVPDYYSGVNLNSALLGVSAILGGDSVAYKFMKLN